MSDPAPATTNPPVTTAAAPAPVQAAAAAVLLPRMWLWLGASGLIVLGLAFALLLALLLRQNQELQDVQAEVVRNQLHFDSVQRSVELTLKQQQNTWDKVLGLEQRLDSISAFDGLTLPVAQALSEVNRALQLLGQVKWRPLQPPILSGAKADTNAATSKSAKNNAHQSDKTAQTQDRTRTTHAHKTSDGRDASISDAAAHSHNPFVPLWQSVKAWLIEQLGDWIRLRPIASVAMAQMDAAQIQSARAQLTVQLLSARLALLSNQVPLARSHLREAQRLAQRIFHPRMEDQQRVLLAIDTSLEKLEP